MKKFKIICSFCCLIGIVWGCTDLEERPVGLLAPEGLFRTVNDVEVAVLGSVGLLATEALYGRQFVSALMLRSDMVDIGDRGTPAARQQMNDFNMDDNNGMVITFWPLWYQVISAANAAIAGAENVEATENQLNPLIAEARFMRAFAYYHLVRNFGEIPYIDFFINDPEAVKTISRTSVNEVYENILIDLEFAKEWLPDTHPNSVRTRATKGTAASYMASVHLTLENWQRAYEEAKWVIDNKDRFGYDLMEDFQDLFNAQAANGLKEHVFAVDFLGLQTGPGNVNVDFNASMTGVRGADRSGWSVMVPSLKVYQTWPEGDYRKRVSFDSAIVMGGTLQSYENFVNTQRPHIAKYTRFPGNAQGEFQQSDHNYAAMRYAEVLLIAAEALGEISGGNAEAVGYLNQVRERARNEAGMMNSFPEDVLPGLDKNAFIDKVIEERRFELAFEFKRWYDIKRRRLGNQAFLGPDSLEPQANFSEARDYLMPLPRQELETNPNLLPQNPGY
ncbi:MAG: RagB/SusD family nutrient uptake outer membrane protein [Mongoliibacter sp.]|uniref:RagB/SusD family nutrient uptake outer membrane protein n=1 Tax=Mongoliibacter sp. TaxID=2022438 RepID=UPI0012F3BB74|nr:RagB/SusD family nutrient uptake outer membrane protein [Mongoliibacter sp.]TVP52551.1 MAG: RagB/SusD family nutrient uptake outer membrane protein [Mongoliibacter sp.]